MTSGRSSVLLERLFWEQEVGGSNPLAPTADQAVGLSQKWPERHCEAFCAEAISQFDLF